MEYRVENMAEKQIPYLYCTASALDQSNVGYCSVCPITDAKTRQQDQQTCGLTSRSDVFCPIM